MAHAGSLRVIGQSLEVAKVTAFDLDTDGPNYVVSSDSLTDTGEWILRHALNPNDIVEQTVRPAGNSRSVCFSPLSISRLDGQARKQRRNNSSLPEASVRLSQLLRALGDQLDQAGAVAFQVSRTDDTFFIDFQTADGQIDSKTFNHEKLRQWSSYSKFRRSGQTGLGSNFADRSKQTKPRNF